MRYLSPLTGAIVLLSALVGRADDVKTIIRSMVQESDPVTQAALQFISRLSGLKLKRAAPVAATN